MAQIRVVAASTLSADRVLAAAHDFSDRRPEIFPAVQLKHMEVHDIEETSADVTEGTRSGPMFNWERCRYDWSEPGVVRADVIGSNIYEVEPSWWELRAISKEGGSVVEMIWEREFKRTPKGRFLKFVYRRFGDRLFGNYGREILENTEKLERA
jgi:hypothetical protein